MNSRTIVHLVAAVFVAIYLCVALSLSFLCDDAFIAFRYSKNLVRHGELVYNLGEYVEGYTSLLWTLVMAAGLACGILPEWLSRVLGVACGLGAILATRRWAQQAHPGTRTAEVAALAVAGLSLPLAAWSTGGLETTAFTLLLTLGIWKTLDAPPSAFPWGAVWLALAALARPEGILVIGVLAAWRSARVWQQREALKPFLVWLIVSSGTVCVHFAWRFWYYGALAPNTIHIKSHSLAAVGHGLIYLATFLSAFPLAGAGLAGIALGASHRQPRAQVFGLLTAVYTAHVVLIGGDFMDLGRFFVPLVPLLAVATADLIALLPHTRRVAVLSAVVLLVHLTISAERYTFTREPRFYWGLDTLALSARYCRQWTALGKWLHDHLEPGERLSTTAAGALPYYAECYTLDELGVADREVARHGEPFSTRPGHRKRATLDMIAARNINYLVRHPILFPQPGKYVDPRAPSYRRAGYKRRWVHVPDCDPPYWMFYYKPLKPSASTPPRG